MNSPLLIHFDIKELVPPSIYQMFGDASIQFLNPKLLRLIHFEREFFGKPMLINNWHEGGSFKERGLRDFMTSTGAKYSIHKFGGARDANIEGMTYREHYQAILDNAEKFLAVGLTTMENIDFTNGWCHADTRITDGFSKDGGADYKWINGILIVNP